ncbi:MAG TPA: SpoIIE family protein phosphatase [Terracidiphilus sp.]
MLHHARPQSLLVLAVALLPCLAIHARAQVVDFQNEREPVVKIHDLWRFHTGDDPDGKLGWAAPGFDDSSWKLLSSDEPWSQHGFSGYTGFAWYRFQVVLPPSQKPMALFIPYISTSYQVFADGRLIGQFGGMPPHQMVVRSFGVGNEVLFPLPIDLTSRGGSLTIAVRVWEWPGWSASFAPGGPWEAVRIGDAGMLDDLRVFRIDAQFRHDFGGNILFFTYLLAGLAGLGLFLLRRGEREYLWFAAAELSSAVNIAWGDLSNFKPLDWQDYWALVGVLSTVTAVCFFMFLAALLKQRRTSLFWIALASALVANLPTLAYSLNFIGDPTWVGTTALANLPFDVCILTLLIFAARRGNLDARLLLGPVALSYCVNILSLILITLYLAGVTSFAPYTRLMQLFNWPFPASAQNIADFLMQISILAILVLRFARTRRDEERHAAELEAARAVQQVLVPENIPAIPGFKIQNVYKPAAEVGGDFSQIIPLADGGLLLAIGDVSGKGVPAAMTVSLLVGTLRTLAHYTQSPREILAAMNQRMIGRTSGGFTTCLVVRLGPDGKIIAANAGHLAPYCAGAEQGIESGLPLGLASHSTYPETAATLGINQQLTLLTDGVVEARGKSGELFGFERTLAISTRPAEVIALAAQDFGQSDDISVISVTRTPAPAPA